MFLYRSDVVAVMAEEKDELKPRMDTRHALVWGVMEVEK